MTWNVEVAAIAPPVRDREELADVAGRLVDWLEEHAGETGPVVSGAYQPACPTLTVHVAMPGDEPNTALSEALALISRGAEALGVTLPAFLAAHVTRSDVGVPVQVA